MQPTVIPVSDISNISAARRCGHELAGALGWSETLCGKLSIVLTEVATNLVKHAKQGELHIQICPGSGTPPGVEILALDRGPGVAQIEACLDDGYSTAGTAGTGLGAIIRLSEQFDIYSQEGKGTCLVARLFPAASNGNRNNGRTFGFGTVQVPVQGETSCGDNWCVRKMEGMELVMVADGLGHGPGAAEASTEAVAAFTRAKDPTPGVILEEVHLALRHTRGAAVAIAQIDAEGERVRFAGAGNISGLVANGSSQQHMISHPGTAGHNVRKIQEFFYRWTATSTLVMHSDGINTNWRIDAYSGIAQHDPSLLAAVLLRDASRGRDDACVVVGREGA